MRGTVIIFGDEAIHYIRYELVYVFQFIFLRDTGGGYERTCGAKHETSTNLKPPKSIMEMSEQELNELLDAYI